MARSVVADAPYRTNREFSDYINSEEFLSSPHIPNSVLQFLLHSDLPANYFNCTRPNYAETQYPLARSRRSQQPRRGDNPRGIPQSSNHITENRLSNEKGREFDRKPKRNGEKLEKEHAQLAGRTPSTLQKPTKMKIKSTKTSRRSACRSNSFDPSETNFERKGRLLFISETHDW